MEWKWTIGEPYERSRRKPKTADNNEPVRDQNKTQTDDAYSSSLNYDENTWDILNQSSSNEGFKSSNKREELDTKIADRELLKQTGYNPFLGENDYAENISIRDQFLKPVNTTSEKERVTEENQ
jgi:hypothetical protein